MSIGRGTGSFKRKRAKNFIADQAQARLTEAIPAIQNQQQNALGVDHHEILYYSKVGSALLCTCKEAHLESEEIGSGDIPPTAMQSESLAPDVQVDWRSPAFGTPGDSEVYGDDSLDDTDFVDSDQQTPLNSSPAIFQADTQCGICFNTGLLPGYSLYGAQRSVFTSYDVTNIYGYFLNRASTPNAFEPLDERDCFIEFELDVPRYFVSARVSVRDNTDLVDCHIWHNGKPLSLRDLMLNAGRTIAIQVREYQFTHCIVEFDLGKKVFANIAQITRVTDWTMYDTIGNLDVVLPVEIPLPQTGDVLVVPKRRLALKVTDVPNMKDADDNNLDWRVSTRILQPQEPLKHIAKLDKVL